MTRLDQLLLTAPDSDIAQAIADELMNVRRLPPYKLAVWHDAKAGPCSLPVHSIIDNGKMCVVVYQNPHEARQWLVKALRMGYTVARQEGRDWFLHRHSVADVRHALDYQRKRVAMTPAERQVEDDSIPF
jgi:hypothetical protein